MKQTQIYQRDLHKVLQFLPEGVMICQRYGNPDVKYWNPELVKLFSFAFIPEEKLYTEQTLL